MNFYNQISYVNTYWNGNKARRFVDDCLEDKKNIELIISNLKEISTIYSHIIDKYQPYGNKITYNLSNKNKIIKKINDFNKKIDTVTRLYSEILSIYNSSVIESEKTKINNCKTMMDNIKTDITKKLDDIENIEKEVLVKINKIDIKYIKEENIIEKYL